MKRGKEEKEKREGRKEGKQVKGKKGKERRKRRSGMSSQRMKIEEKNRMPGELKLSVRVNIPLRGKSFSTAVLAATRYCKNSPPLLGVKRGCAAHAPVQMCTFSLNRIALYTGRGPGACQLTSEQNLHLNTALSSPFFPWSHFAPLKTTANNKKTPISHVVACHFLAKTDA